MATATDTVVLGGEAREVALAEAQAVLSHVQDTERRERIADLVADVDEGHVSPETASALEEILELGLQTGRIRAIYGPGGEQAALATFRKLPRGADLTGSAREVSEALTSLTGREIESISLVNIGPGTYTLSLSAEGIEVSVRLDRQGARLQSVGL